MSVRKRTWTTRRGEAKEAWIVDYTDADGDRHIETFERKKDADARHAQVAVNIARGTHHAPSKSITVAEAADRWIKAVEAKGAERSTLEQYRQHIDLHIVPRIGAAKLANLTATNLDNFRNDLLANMSRPLARKVMTSLKSLLKTARYSHVIADVEVIGKSKRERKLEVGRDIPTAGEIKRLIDTASKGSKLRALLLTMALAGLRASELRGLRWSDVDLKGAELHVRQRADRYKVIGAPKSDSSARAVPLPPDVVTALREWKLPCPKGEHDLDLVFPTSDGAIDNQYGVAWIVKRVMKAAGVVDKAGEPKYAPHAFRHFFASWCINRKVDGGRELPAKVVQGLLGHSSIAMTLDRYGHLFPRGDDRAELAEAARALLA
jgi:integrase